MSARTLTIEEVREILLDVVRDINEDKRKVTSSGLYSSETLAFISKGYTRSMIIVQEATSKLDNDLQ